MARTTESAATVDPFGLAGTVLDKKFRVERKVAEGGNGVVYYAEHLTLQKPIAVKVLRPPMDLTPAARAAFMDRFALEARTIARISHPAIVQVLDFGASKMPSGQAAPWMVLEWLTGQTLEADLAARRGRGGRSPAETLALLRPALEAVAYAHEEGIAHRDIKPANLMLVSNRRGVTIRLLDFGIAKIMEAGEEAAGQARTRSALSLYSPAYAAPEQVLQTRTGPWTDVFALALLVSELLTDQPPYDSQDVAGLLAQVAAPARPTPAQRGVDVGAWEPVLRVALALNPEHRYPDAGALLAALEANVPGVVSRASPLAAPVPPAGWTGREPAPQVALQNVSPAPHGYGPPAPHYPPPPAHRSTGTPPAVLISGGALILVLLTALVLVSLNSTGRHRARGLAGATGATAASASAFEGAPFAQPNASPSNPGTDAAMQRTLDEGRAAATAGNLTLARQSFNSTLEQAQTAGAPTGSIGARIAARAALALGDLETGQIQRLAPYPSWRESSAMTNALGTRYDAAVSAYSRVETFGHPDIAQCAWTQMGLAVERLRDAFYNFPQPLEDFNGIGRDMAATNRARSGTLLRQAREYFEMSLAPRLPNDTACRAAGRAGLARVNATPP